MELCMDTSRLRFNLCVLRSTFSRHHLSNLAHWRIGSLPCPLVSVSPCLRVAIKFRRRAEFQGQPFTMQSEFEILNDDVFNPLLDVISPSRYTNWSF
jgi:hypothetical protein